MINGAPLTLGSATLGHVDLKTTSVYAHARPGESSGRYLKTRNDAAERGLCSSVTGVCPHQSMQTPRRSKPISSNAMRVAYTRSRSTPLELIFPEARVQRAGGSR